MQTTLYRCTFHVYYPTVHIYHSVAKLGAYWLTQKYHLFSAILNNVPL